MSADNLLCLARETVNAVPTCLAVTIDGNGDANARAINTSKLTDEWTVRFMTDRRTRKFGEIVRTGRMTLVYYHQAGSAYVTLAGRARIIDDVTVKQRCFTFDASEDERFCTPSPSRRTAPLTTVRLIGYRQPYRDECPRSFITSGVLP